MTGLRCPHAILTACAQSHSFDDRRFPVPCAEEDAIKIGRSLARWKPSSDNAIFDCKVLSRNHAVMWYEEGLFLLKDTKSSNGTFVNNDRLSKSGEESPPRQIFSGDILQFGVEIVENANKVTHGCIVAIISLYDISGEEAFPPEHLDQSSYLVSRECELSQSFFPLINSQQLFQFQQFMREAICREHALEQKLAVLQNVLSSTEQAAENSWQALINEDRLLSRIEMLEGQLALYSKTTLGDKVKEHMSELLVDKNKFESLAKEALHRAQEEKFEALQRLADAERSLLNAEEEASMLRQRSSGLESELVVAVETNNALRELLVKLNRQVRTVESKPNEMSISNNSVINEQGDRGEPLDVFTSEACSSQSVKKRNFNGLTEKNGGSDGEHSTCLPVLMGDNDNANALLLCTLPFLSAMFLLIRLGKLITAKISTKLKYD